MGKFFWIAAIILIVAIVILFDPIGTIQSDIRCVQQDASISGGYCIYNHIPTNLNYTDHRLYFQRNGNTTKVMIYTESKWTQVGTIEKFITNSNINNYLARDNTPKSLSEGFGNDYSHYTCVNTGQTPQTIQYYYYMCQSGLMGCGKFRSAIVCGNTYFINDFSESEGPHLYGPLYLNQ